MKKASDPRMGGSVSALLRPAEGVEAAGTSEVKSTGLTCTSVPLLNRPNF